METISTNELNYRGVGINSPSYRYHGITQETGGDNVTLNANGGQLSRFILPSRCFNPSKCMLEYTISIPEGPNATFNWIYANVISHFQQIRFRTKTNINICEINDVGQYSSLVLLPETKFEEMKTYDTYSYLAPPQGVGIHGVSNFLRPCNSLAADNLRVIQNTGTLANWTSSINYDEPLYVYITPQSNGGGAGNVQFHISLPFSMLRNTFLSLNKDFIFPENTFLEVKWNSTNKILFTSTQNVGIAGAAPYPNNIAITNLRFRMACETNPQIEQELWAKINSAEGFVYKIPFLWCENTAINAGLNRSITVRLDSSSGSKLLKSYLGVFDNNMQNETAYEHSNWNASKISEYYITLENERLTENNLTTANFHDYREYKDSFRGSCILNNNMFYYNWFIPVKFIHDKNLLQCDDLEDNYDHGLDLSVERKLVFNLTHTQQGQAYQYFVFNVTKKELMIKPNLIQVI